MITTIADLILKFASSLFESKGALRRLERERRDRLAAYFERIAELLVEAADEFEAGRRPRHLYSELSYYLDRFSDVAGKAFRRQKDLAAATAQLKAAVDSDHLLLGGSKERILVDWVTARPWVVPEAWASGNPVAQLNEEELKQVVVSEINNLRHVSGLFRAISVEVAATD